jgi:hypothetical protein
MTVLKIQGTERSINLTSQQINKHSISIMHWADGGSIEELYGPDWVNYLDTPTFDIKIAYRPAKVYPDIPKHKTELKEINHSAIKNIVDIARLEEL